MSKNISNEELNKEIKKWMESFSTEEWLEKLREEKYLYELNKWLSAGEDLNSKEVIIDVFRSEYTESIIEGKRELEECVRVHSSAESLVKSTGFEGSDDVNISELLPWVA